MKDLNNEYEDVQHQDIKHEDGYEDAHDDSRHEDMKHEDMKHEDVKDNQEYNELLIKYSDLDNQYKRLQADLVNMMKRTVNVENESYDKAISKFANEIIALIDVFMLAKQNCGSNKEVLTGITMLEHEFLQKLAIFQIQRKEINIGDMVDADVEVVELRKGPHPDSICEIIMYPFFYKDKLIKPGKVIAYI